LSREANQTVAEQIDLSREANRAVAEQLQLSRTIALGEFLLNVDKMFDQHQEVHLALRPGGKWSQKGNAPQSGEEWAKVEDYMGLMEQYYVLVDKGIIDKEIVRHFIKYRLQNIFNNETIRKTRLEDPTQRYRWTQFIAFCKLLEIEGIDELADGDHSQEPIV
ncbi:MAG: hypothetical protein GYB65_11285, partial [Chloroflexi bacterium]|nr:hypothetical protein [Chloroflexota bacterium]